MDRFILHSSFNPTGDQPEAITELTNNFKNGIKRQVLLGATGTGKTFTIANVIKNVNKPTLILAHNKTLAGQLYSELKEFFPENAVEFFISYYDYYQPEAYVVSSDTYIEKEATINDEIDELRHSATMSLMERRDVIVVASVSCIYGIGDPEDYKNSMLMIRVGDNYLTREKLLRKLVDMLYLRTNLDLERGTFRSKGDTVEILPPYSKEIGIRIDFDFDQIERIREFDVVTGKTINDKSMTTIYPATQFVTNKEKLEEALKRIGEELEDRIKYFKDKGQYLEAERIEQRTRYDMEILEEVGTCSGVENYSRHLSLRGEGETPSTLMDFFPDDFLLVVDESHVTIPQVRGMYNGDRSRKQNLVDFGFRLPSALDNRPLNFQEFESKINQVIFMSATPSEYEMENAPVIEQIIRPTGLLDPRVYVKKTEGQIDDVIERCEEAINNNERVLITTLTIKMSEDLTAYLKNLGYKVAYLHSEIKSLERLEVIRNLRLGTYDILVGINLLREGLDIPEVSTILILDADKEGFLRSEKSLIQTIGRAARNANGRVILYGDIMTDSMANAIKETERRRSIQEKYNLENGIIPKTIIKDIPEELKVKIDSKEIELKEYVKSSKKNQEKIIRELEKEMNKAAKELNFERAMELRDLIFEMKSGN